MGRTDVTDIITAGVKVSGYSRDELLGKKRSVGLCTIRAICCKLMRDELGMTTTNIGFAMGGRDHATIINSLKRIDGWLETKDRFATDKYYKIRNRWKQMC